MVYVSPRTSAKLPGMHLARSARVRASIASRRGAREHTSGGQIRARHEPLWSFQRLGSLAQTSYGAANNLAGCRVTELVSNMPQKYRLPV